MRAETVLPRLASPATLPCRGPRVLPHVCTLRRLLPPGDPLHASPPEPGERRPALWVGEAWLLRDPVLAELRRDAEDEESVGS